MEVEIELSVKFIIRRFVTAATQAKPAVRRVVIYRAKEGFFYRYDRN